MIHFNRFPGGKTKCFTLSYDDGNVADRRLIEIINSYGIRATFHLNSTYLGLPNRVSKDEIVSLYKGHEISAHAAHHPYLERMPAPLALKDVYEDRMALEGIADSIVRGMSYPYGTYNDTVIEILKNVGICYCRTVKATHAFTWPENFLTWHPTCHHNDDSLKYIKSFKESTSRGLLLYIWGHSYEFNNNNNWELLEEMCKTVTTDAGEEWYQKADNVWFATNIEIYDYITAVRNLIVSLDGKIIYNPSSQDVWVEYNGEAIKIGGGETVHL